MVMFLLGIFAAILIAHIACFVASACTSEGKAKVAGFSFALGLATSLGFDAATLGVGLIFSLGVSVGVVIAWISFFKRAEVRSVEQ